MSPAKEAIIIRSGEQGPAGVESEASADSYDRQVTLIGLNPVAPVEFPQHVRWARQARDLARATVTKQWLISVRASKLKEMGCPDVVGEQKRLFSCRVASSLKAPSLDEAVCNLKQLFSE